jgi:hypothetical protein
MLIASLKLHDLIFYLRIGNFYFEIAPQYFKRF